MLPYPQLSIPQSPVTRARHTPLGGRYTIINCCPELPYSAERFKSGEVVKYDIQDHTPPTMVQFVAFLNSMREKPPSRLLAVHCRGGKGRTGSMACAQWALSSDYLMMMMMMMMMARWRARDGALSSDYLMTTTMMMMMACARWGPLI